MAKRIHQAYPPGQPYLEVFPTPVETNRDPVAATDTAYPFGQEWINKGVTPHKIYKWDGTNWFWLNGTGGSAIDTITTDDAVAVPATLNNLFLSGDGVEIETIGDAAGSKITIHAGSAVATSYTEDSGSAIPSGNSLNVLGTRGVTTIGSGNTVTVRGVPTTSSSSSSLANLGTASFKSTDFDVDVNGFVQLKGHGIAIDSIQLDGSAAPGTNPIVPDSNGKIIITGGQTAAASTSNAIQTKSLAANSFTIEVQKSSSSAVSDANVNGICHFDSAAFGVNADGFVTLGASPTKILQTVRTIRRDWYHLAGTNYIAGGDAIPQITQGYEALTVGITPISASSILGVTVCLYTGWSSTDAAVIAVFKSSSTNAFGIGIVERTTATDPVDYYTGMFYTTSGTTSAINISARVASQAAFGSLDMYINGGNTSRQFGGACCSSITVTEYEA